MNDRMVTLSSNPTPLQPETPPWVHGGYPYTGRGSVVVAKLAIFEFSAITH
jgi:hypothetical protein